ncbi:MAG: SET domain-containing protein [Chitinophagaceae bacterium]|jgi:SET domain-containing protein|nr:SET domain-containing protein-lysine N-methyltransferase [Chitinophagaceae bacterium]MBP9739045.1 SET domain-containing protein-lysine N-methyltransferase [Chitinophagaceae bacterium]
MILSMLFISDCGKKGKGVFSAENIPANTTIEISPVLVLNANERGIVEGTMLYNYIFEWGNNKKKAALGMGYISMYNHSYLSNCEYEMDYAAATMSIKTVRDIVAGEELTINYNAVHNDATPVWFETHN